MKVIRTIAEMRRVSKEIRLQKQTLGCVPTMGYLHEGHLSLIRDSLNQTGQTVVTIYVNPTQFGPHEDLEHYPRDEERDVSLLEKEGVDVVFIPDHAEIYPEGFSTYVNPPVAAEHWCGASRPGHFRGVCTIVAILFNIIHPTHAFFGQKDAQQCAVIQSMVDDLKIPVQIHVCPTVREDDGLAMSSRNKYLSEDERKDALALYQTLQQGIQRFQDGTTKADDILLEGFKRIQSNPNIRLDYLAVVDEKTFQPVDFVRQGHFYIGAIYAGKTRLIDNIRF